MRLSALANGPDTGAGNGIRLGADALIVPAPREELDVLVAEDRGPGRPWKPGPPVQAAPAAAAAKRSLDGTLLHSSYNPFT
ncbi:hypothetical protein [Streptomyces sp. NPDC054888]